MYDVISIGDATLDVFVKIAEASVLCNLDRESCQICFAYADKIPVESLHETVGGNAANNAVGASRLGLKTAIYVHVGHDETGQKIHRALERAGVSCEFIRMVPRTHSNYSVVLNYQGERTILVYHQRWQYELPKLPPAKWVYLTSMGKEFRRIHPSLVGDLKDNGTRLCFNPGTHQLKAGRVALVPILRESSILILNKDEAKILLGRPAEKEIKNILKGLVHLGPKIAVVTDGQNGSWAYDGLHFWAQSVFPGKRIEATGAGDAFATAFLAAIICDCPVSEALAWGAVNATSVIQKIGPEAGLLDRPTMLKTVKAHPELKAKTI